MKRRTMLSLTAAAGAATLGRWPALADPAARAGTTRPGWTSFEVRTQIELHPLRGPATLWLPLLQTAGEYQTVGSTSWRGDGHSLVVHDDRYRAPILRTTWAGDEPGRRVELVQHVSVRGPRGSEPARLDEDERRLWTAPTPSAPTDGIVRATAMAIVAGRSSDVDRVRAIYDWVVDRTHRDPAVAGCGTGDVKAMLERGQFGGKCADINGLFVALARAAGYPARDVYGIRLGPATLSASFGPKTSDVSKAQHCRAEVFLPTVGWFPVDPADVRKVVLEEGLPTSDAHVERVRAALFGHWEMNWAGYNSATDIALPGGSGQRPDFPFLMYPCAFTTDGEAPCVDPEGFRYRIVSTPIAA